MAFFLVLWTLGFALASTGVAVLVWAATRRRTSPRKGGAVPRRVERGGRAPARRGAAVPRRAKRGGQAPAQNGAAKSRRVERDGQSPAQRGDAEPRREKRGGQSPAQRGDAESRRETAAQGVLPPSGEKPLRRAAIRGDAHLAASVRQVAKRQRRFALVYAQWMDATGATGEGWVLVAHGAPGGVINAPSWALAAADKIVACHFEGERALIPTKNAVGATKYTPNGVIFVERPAEDALSVSAVILQPAEFVKEIICEVEKNKYFIFIARIVRGGTVSRGLVLVAHGNPHTNMLEAPQHVIDTADFIVCCYGNLLRNVDHSKLLCPSNHPVWIGPADNADVLVVCEQPKENGVSLGDETPVFVPLADRPVILQVPQFGHLLNIPTALMQDGRILFRLHGFITEKVLGWMTDEMWDGPFGEMPLMGYPSAETLRRIASKLGREFVVSCCYSEVILPKYELPGLHSVDYVLDAAWVRVGNEYFFAYAKAMDEGSWQRGFDIVKTSSLRKIRANI